MNVSYFLSFHFVDDNHVYHQHSLDFYFYNIGLKLFTDCPKDYRLPFLDACGADLTRMSTHWVAHTHNYSLLPVFAHLSVFDACILIETMIWICTTLSTSTQHIIPFKLLLLLCRLSMIVPIFGYKPGRSTAESKNIASGWVRP